MDPTEHKLRTEYDDIAGRMTDPALFGTPEMVALAKRQAELSPLIELYDRRRTLADHLAQNHEMLSDPELGELAREEIPALEEQLARTNDELRLALVPKDPADAKNAVIEIRAGAGGDEASLFAGELYRMYARYVENQPGWHIELVSESPSDVGGYKEIIFEIKGPEAYGWLKYESGVHRVQRVPETESQGRVHTSTVTVAVLPEAEETDLEIREQDLRIDVYRSGGHGGQSVNTTDSAVRITHLPSGLVVTCQDEKSQLKNKLKAMGVLRSRLLALKMEEEQRENREVRLGQIGTGDRSEKIRTYNFPQDRVTDHRIGRTQHGLPGFMLGGIHDMLEALRAEDLRLGLEQAAT
ncbi:MAG TPA: peptide chain release factor 1 [Candidatus Saccharimonadia bacterium]|nr:peptide chain release factor 1 [Candidatus Saccharimonadia bacterium]